MGKIVFGIAATPFQAEAVVNEFKVAEFPDENISVVFADKMACGTQEGMPPVPGGLGWLPDFDEVFIPGVGPFFAAGPIRAALSAAAVGGLRAGISEALMGMGLAEISARRMEKKARAGSILLAVHSETDTQAARARAIFEQAQAGDIFSTVETEPFAAEPPHGETDFGERSNAST